jgi:GTPase SAR1 family protein
MSYTQIKLVAVGDGACGKTSALLTFSAGMFPVEYVPTVFDNFATNMMVDKVPINLNLWGMF